MSINLVDENGNPVAQQPVIQQQAVQQPVQQASIQPVIQQPVYVTAPAPAPVVQQPAPIIQTVTPANMATKEDVAKLAEVINKQAFDVAIQSFTAKHPDISEVSVGMMEILEKNPALWDTGYDTALKMAYDSAKLSAIQSGTANLQAQTAQMNAEINNTAQNVQAASNTSANTNPLNSQTDGEDDLGARLLKMAQSDSLF